MEPRVGDIWKEVDPRSERHVVVIGCASDRPRGVQIQTAYRAPETINWRTAGPMRWVKGSRFNGKHGGYALVIRSTAV